MIEQILKYQSEAHRINLEKGFWEEGPDKNKGEMVMLIVTELSEAVEAHRKNKRYRPSWNWEHNVLPNWNDDSIGMQQYTTQAFISSIKDTVEDEIADTVIRILDYTAGWNIELNPAVQVNPHLSSEGNFALDILKICEIVIHSYNKDKPSMVCMTSDWSYTLQRIIKFCEWYNINLIQHIEWKLRYNSIRPYKHGKSY